jgi:hypothetical protein
MRRGVRIKRYQVTFGAIALPLRRKRYQVTFGAIALPLRAFNPTFITIFIKLTSSSSPLEGERAIKSQR